MPNTTEILLAITTVSLVGVVFMLIKKEQQHKTNYRNFIDSAEEQIEKMFERFSEKIDYELFAKLNKIGERLEEMEKHQRNITFLQKELNNLQDKNIRLSEEIAKLQSVLARKSKQIQRYRKKDEL